MDKQTLRKISLPLNVAANYMDGFAGDLFVDLPVIADCYEHNRIAVELIGKTHADEVSRYLHCLLEQGKNEKDITIKDCMEFCDETLGWDFALVYAPMLNMLKVVYNTGCEKIGEAIQQRIIDWGSIGWNCVDTMSVEEFPL
jgi:hypothetical protein